MQAKRFFDLTSKAWKYGLGALERPGRIPWLLLQVSRGAHLGQLVNLHCRWLRQAGIETVIDVGAHTGEFSSAIRSILPHARIYAFEPIPECYSRLVTRFSRNGQFQGFPVAVGNRTGRTEFYESSFTQSSSVLPMGDLHRAAFPWSAQLEPITVEMRRLDDCLDEMELRRKVLLKLDVQGYELEALRGATKLVLSVDFAFVEVSFRQLYERQSLFARVYDFLSCQGFRFHGVLGQLTSPLDDSILQADAIFIRNG